MVNGRGDGGSDTFFPHLNGGLSVGIIQITLPGTEGDQSSRSGGEELSRSGQRLSFFSRDHSVRCNSLILIKQFL